MTHDDRAVRIAYAMLYVDRRPGRTIDQQADAAGKALGSRPEDVLASDRRSVRRPGPAGLDGISHPDFSD
jgi:hypothetical protein